MVDTNNPDEEYHLPGEEPEGMSGSSYTNEPPVLPKRRMWARNLLLVVAVLGTIYGLYQLVNSFISGPALPGKPVPPPVVIQPAPTPVTPAVPTEEVSAQAKKVDAISEMIQQNREDINLLKTSIADVKASSTDVDSRFSDTNFAIQNLTKQVSQLQQQLDAFQKLYMEANQKKPLKKVVKLPKYYIEAIIPGRAWIKRENDTRITISQGDAIAGYGVVTAINPEAGTVSTSSGRTIEYSPKDR